MNNSNPLIPQGSLLEQKNKGRARVKVAVFCVLSLHLLVLCPMLILGCKQDKSTDQTSDNTAATNTASAPVDTNLAAPPPGPASNIVAAPLPPPPTNPPVAPPPVNPLPVESGTKEYVVVKGDILFTIAKKFGVSVKSIENANPGLVPTKLKVGQKLQIPAGGAASSGAMASAGGAAAPADSGDTTTYVVKSGDNLTKIAKLNGTTVKAIHAANPSLKGNAIKVGQKLKVPARSAVAATTETAPPPLSANPVTAAATNPALGTAR